MAGRMVRGLIPDGAPKEVLSGMWLGHALHPIMTDVPIAAWTSSVLLDWAGGEDSESASDRLILTGLLAAGATIATGWSDWADAEQRTAAVRRSGLVHAATNGTATRVDDWLLYRVAGEALEAAPGCSRLPARLR